MRAETLVSMMVNTTPRRPARRRSAKMTANGILESMRVSLRLSTMTENGTPESTLARSKRFFDY
jgi:hypothetical protein